MPTSYRYAVRSIHGVTKLESELLALSSQAWEPVNLQRDSAGTYEVVLRQELNGHTQTAGEKAEPESAPVAPVNRFVVRSIHGVAKIGTELTDLSSEGWEPLTFHLDGSGTCEILLRQNQAKNPPGVHYNYSVRSVHGIGKLESELTDLSNGNWEPLYFHHDAAGTYHVILRQVHEEQARVEAALVEPKEPEQPLGVAHPYRYSVRHMHGTEKLESELSTLSNDSWEPLSFTRDAAGNYEVILRQEVSVP